MNEKLRRILTRQSETREALNTLMDKDTLTDAEQATLKELRGKMGEIEKELREALAEDPEPDPEARETETVDAEERERRELRERCGLHRYVAAALNGGDAGRVDGAEAEYSDAMGCPGLVPLTMLGGTMEERQATHRPRRLEARDVTPAPSDSDVPHTHAPIVPALFDRSVAPFLGIEMPTVSTGIQSYPVISTSVSGGMKGEDTDAPNTAGAFAVTDADPRRLTGAFTIRKEDVAKLPGLEESLRQNLGQVLSDEFDKQAVNGNGARPNLNGILQQLTDPAAPAAGAETYARYQAALSSHIDGLFATMPGDVRALVGVQTMRHMLGVYRANEDATTAYDMAQTRYGGVRATRRIADPANNIQQAIVRRANPAGDRVAVAPVWMGIELIRDIFGDNAKKGQITVTGTALVGGIVLLRSDVFVQDSFRLAA